VAMRSSRVQRTSSTGLGLGLRTRQSMAGHGAARPGGVDWARAREGHDQGQVEHALRRPIDGEKIEYKPIHV
jgi:hypothetical protein